MTPAKALVMRLAQHALGLARQTGWLSVEGGLERAQRLLAHHPRHLEVGVRAVDGVAQTDDQLGLRQELGDAISGPRM